MRITKALLAIVVATFLAVIPIIPVLGAINYTSTITVTSDTAYAMLPVRIACNNAGLAANSYITSTGRDVKIAVSTTNLSRMLTTNETIFAIPVTVNSTSTAILSTKNTPSDFAIITGQDGYLSSTTIAPYSASPNMTLTIKGYFVMTAMTGMGFASFTATSGNSMNLTCASNGVMRFGPGVCTLTLPAATGYHEVLVSWVSNNVTLTVDGTSNSTTTAAGGLFSGMSNWTFCRQMPYVTSVNLTDYNTPAYSIFYQPNTIISGSTVPNRTTASYNGTIIWGDNPAGVTYSMGYLSPGIQQASSGANLDPGTRPDVVPTYNPQHWNAPATPTNPASPIVEVGATLWDVDVTNVWFFIGIVLTLGAFMAIAIFLQHLGWAIVAGCLVMGLFCSIDIFPKGMLIFAVLGLVGGVVQEVKA